MIESQAPASISRAKLDSQSQEYQVWKASWEQYSAFYVGGDFLKKNAPTYLIKSQREPSDIYGDRVQRSYYENYIGSIINWYAATLLRIEPEVVYPDEEFIKSFTNDCDGAGTHLYSFCRDLFVTAQIYKKVFILVDFPKLPEDKKIANRAQETEAGLDQPRLIAYNPLDVYDFKMDRAGRLEWVKIRTVEKFRASFSDPMMLKTTWTIYDRSGWARYVKETKADEATNTTVSAATGNDASAGTDAASTRDDSVPRVEAGAHAFAAMDVVPIIVMEMPEGLWLSNQAGSLAWQHYQMSNALSWQLHMSAYAMPVIKTSRNWNEMMGPAYFIRLGPNDEFGWSEPGGQSTDILMRNLERLRQEIYRVCYLMSQSQAENAGNIGQSGLSKSFDYQATLEVLRTYGGIIKTTLTEVLKKVAVVLGHAKQDENLDDDVDVRGFSNFDIRAVDEDINLAESAKGVVTLSPLFNRELEKHVSHRVLPDLSREMKEKIDAEIDTNPMPQLELAGQISDATGGGQQQDEQPGQEQEQPQPQQGQPEQQAPKNKKGWQRSQ